MDTTRETSLSTPAADTLRALRGQSFRDIDTFKLLAADPGAEGFVSVESARMVIAKALADVARQIPRPHHDDVLAIAREIAPGEV